MTKKLQIHSPSRIFHDLGRQTITGYFNGILSGYGPVRSAVDDMIQIPQMMSAPRAGSNVQVSIRGSDDLTNMVASMIEVRVDGKIQTAMTPRTIAKANLVGVRQLGRLG